MVMIRNQRKEKIGKVLSNKADKSITVAIVRRLKHPVYGKFLTKTSKLMAHDAQNICKIGDLVKIAETRPLSKKKCWRMVKVLKEDK